MLEKFYWIVVYPLKWHHPTKTGWCYEIQTLSRTRAEAKKKCLQDLSKKYTWEYLRKGGRKIIKVTIQELKN